MVSHSGVHCTACGFLHEAAHQRHHCEHCFADTTYLRTVGNDLFIRRAAGGQERSLARG